MAHIARTLGAVAQQQQRGASEGRTESFKVMVQSELAKSSDVELLDSVFKAFLMTNKHRHEHYTMEDLIRTSDTSFKRYFWFEHLSIPYLATVFTYQGHDYDWLNIKLCNDGFVYTPRTGKSDTWETPLECLGFLSSTVKPLYDSARVFYNYAEQRIDIKLYPITPHGSPHGTPSPPALLVTFEPGTPYMDETVERGPF
jgi:hypothetical protein